MKKLLIAMAVGAAVAWLFDPDNGSRRRESLRRKLDERGLTDPAAATPGTSSSVTDLSAPIAAAGR